MPNTINNVDLDKISKTIEEEETISEWNSNPGEAYQFKTELAYERGKHIIETDTPSFLGGNGNRLGPMAYCVAGITSCFIATFVTIASS